MIKKIEERILELEERRKQCKSNINNANISENIKWYEKGYYVALRDEIKFLKKLINEIKGE